MPDKVPWHGRLTSVQPRIRLLRSLDQFAHVYLGYLLQVGELAVGVGKAAQSKHGFRVGDEVGGESVPVEDARMEPCQLYKTSKLALVSRSNASESPSPPWLGPPPELPAYRARGHRRLDARTYIKSCQSCIWGCRMPVEMTIDHWNPTIKRYQFETFCYGPKSCPLYRAGPVRKVPGRKGMVWEHEDWVDEDATAHRGPDE